MSKAFTKETDSEIEADEEEESRPRMLAAQGLNTPAQGFKNYITPQGFKKLQEELYQLKHKTRPEVTAVVSWAASNGDRSENADYHYGKKKLREIDRRLRYLTKSLDSAEIVDYLKNAKKDQVFFGATVTVRNEDNTENIYTIVGIDEMDLEKGRISWHSPLANSLFKAAVGDFVSFKTPKGIREIEIIDVQYEEWE